MRQVCFLTEFLGSAKKAIHPKWEVSEKCRTARILKLHPLRRNPLII